MDEKVGCVNARTILLAKETGMLSRNETTEAEIHLSTCEECRRYFQYDEQFRQLLRQKLTQTVTPPSLRESLLQQVSEQSTKHSKFKPLSRWKRRLFGRAGAVVALVLVGSIAVYLGFVKHQDEPSPLLPSLLIQDHIEFQLRENPYDVQTSDKTQLEGWLAKRVDFAVNIPVIQNAELRGGRLCYLFGRRVAFALFEKDGRPISAYILDGTGVDLSSIGGSGARSGKRICKRSEKGYNAILWESNGLIYALVSSMQPDELEAVARIYE